MTKDTQQLADALKEAIELRVKLYQNGCDCDSEHTCNAVSNDPYAKKWSALLAAQRPDLGGEAKAKPVGFFRVLRTGVWHQVHPDAEGSADVFPLYAAPAQADSAAIASEPVEQLIADESDGAWAAFEKSPNAEMSNRDDLWQIWHEAWVAARSAAPTPIAPTADAQPVASELLEAAEAIISHGQQHDVGGGDVFISTCDAAERLERAVRASKGKDACSACGQPWDAHEFAVPAPYCPAPAEKVTADAVAMDESGVLAWEVYLDEQKRILGMPGLLARPCFLAGYRAALAPAAVEQTASDKAVYMNPNDVDDLQKGRARWARAFTGADGVLDGYVSLVPLGKAKS